MAERALGRFTLALVAAASLSLAGAQASALIIDDFESGAFSITGGVGSASGTQTGSMQGGVRDLTVTTLQFTSNATLALTGGDDGVVMSLASGSLSQAFYEFVWDGTPGPGNQQNLGPLDLSADIAFELDFPQISTAGNGTRVKMFIRSGAGNRNTPDLFVLSTGTFQVPFSDFTQGPAAVNFAAIDRIVLLVLVDHFSANDVAVLNELRTVPEPATAALVGLGLAGLVWGRRRP